MPYTLYLSRETLSVSDVCVTEYSSDASWLKPDISLFNSSIWQFPSDSYPTKTELTFLGIWLCCGKRKIRYKTSLSFKLLLFMLFRCWGSCSSRSILLMKQEPGTSKSTIDGISAVESFGIKFNSRGLTVTVEKKLSGKILDVTLSCLILAKTSCFFLEISFLAPHNVVRTTKVFLVTEHFLERLKDQPVRQSSN